MTTLAANSTHSFVRMISVFILTFCTASFSVAASAEIPTPRLKPAPPALSQYLSESDARTFRKGLTAVKKGDWRDLERKTESLSDPVARDVLIWLRAARQPNPPRSVLEYAAHDLANYPRMTAVRSKAEKDLFENPLSAQKTLDWFATYDPVSGEGRAALARAHYALGNQQSGDLWLKLAWRESKLTRDRQRALFGKYKNRLSQDDHAARADHLIWEGRYHFSKAQALLQHMSRDDRLLMNARMKLAQNGSGMDAAVKAIPASLQTDPGFLFERARWRRKRLTKEKALPLYLQINSAPKSDKGKSRLWTERKIMAYWAIKEGNYNAAYGLTRAHGATRGAPFYEPEFLAGWLSLRKLGNAQQAATHFGNLKRGVTTPISLARADYWLGRAYEEMGDPRATGHYAEAAQHPNTYYGQLAASRNTARLSQIYLPQELVTDDVKAAFNSDPLVRALHLLGEAGEERYFSQFAFHMDDEVQSEGYLSLLSQLSKDYGYMRPSVRAAKQAGRFQTMLTDSGYPTVGSIDALPAKFNKPFVYAIARQESEFATNAVSSASAYGMMQMINATAKSTARKHRIPYSRTRLASDGDYAANLGAHHLHDLLEIFDGSYILASVGYNAGPTRAKEWIKAYGDPRTGEIDPVDWVEKIPFSETRNYVQRVMENMQVYRARLNGNQAPNQMEQDLRNGAF